MTRAAGGWGAARRARAPRRRPLAFAAIAALVGGAGVVTASASTLGGLDSDTLGSAGASTSHVPAVTLEWTGEPRGDSWDVAAVRVRAEEHPFAAGDEVKLTVAGAASDGVAPCEVRTTPVASTAEVLFGQREFAACGRLPFAQIDTVAVSVDGIGVEPVSTGSGLGEVRTALAAYAGGVRDAARAPRVSVATTLEDGVAVLSQITVDVPRGATAAGLVGERVDVALRGNSGSAPARFGGLISSDPGAPVRVVTDPAGVGETFPSVVIDPRAGRPRAEWPRAAAVTSFSVLLSAPQRLDSAHSAPAISMASGQLAQRGGTALDAIDLDKRLSYAYAPTRNHTNGLTFCHVFAVTNTSKAPVTWKLAFDTSLEPLWGLDPTSPGAFSSQWGFTTTSFDARTHRWTIGGPAGDTVLAPGQTRSDMGYCAQNVPEPPVDPARYAASVSVVPGSSDWDVQLQVSIRSDSDWNVPWELTVDLADHVCGASLKGQTVTFSRVQATPVPGSSTAYVLRGTTGDTRYVSSDHPRDFVFAAYPAGNSGWHLPCK